MNSYTAQIEIIAPSDSQGVRHAANHARRCRTAGKAGWQELPSRKLLQLCLMKSEEGAWCEFVRRYQPLMASVIVKTLRRRIRPRPALVDDLVQETYLKLCADNSKALRAFDPRHDDALAGFLKVVASNVAQDYLRKSLCRKRGSGKGEDDLEQANPCKACVASSADSMEREIVLGQVERCLEKELSGPHLTRDCKIFWLYYRDGLTAKAISLRSDIGLSIKGIESTLMRLTQLVRTKLGRRQRDGRRSIRTTAA